MAGEVNIIHSSVHIRQLHQKLRCPTTFVVRFWQSTDEIFSTTSWTLNKQADTQTPKNAYFFLTIYM